MDDIRILQVEGLPMQRRAWAQDFAFDRHVVLPEGESDRASVRVYSIPPGKANYPYHWHEKHEEYFIILSGEGLLHTPKGGQPVRAGDLITCPTGEAGAHQLVNPSDTGPLVYLEFDVVEYPEIVHYPRSGAWGVIFRDKARNRFYRGDERIAYDDLV